MPTVARLSIAPVKSTHLHHPEEVRLEPFGVPGNRRFYFARPDGRLYNGSKHGPLVAIRAEYDPGEERLRLCLPDGSVLEGDATSLSEPVISSFWGREVRGHVLAGSWTEALTAHVGEPVNLVRPELPGDGNDSFPVSLFSTASAEELARRSGSDRALDSRRFRMLVEVGGAEPHQEDTWIGREVRVGEALVRVADAVDRCVITTQDPSTGIPDFDSLKHIAAYRRAPGGTIDFGVYAEVVEAGTIRVGDPVEPLPS